VEADSLLKQPGDLPIRPTLAAEFPDQFAVGFELRAWRFRWKAGKFEQQARRFARYFGV
jgi:hypothetical protein